MIPYMAFKRLRDYLENIQEIMENNSEDTLNGIIDYTHIWNDLRYMLYAIDCDNEPTCNDYYDNTLET